MPLVYKCRVVTDQPLVPAVDLESNMRIFTGFSFLSLGFMSERLYLIPLLTGEVTKDEKNCDHKTRKTSKRENHLSMSGPIG